MVTDRKIRSNETPRIKRIWNIHNQPININYEVENLKSSFWVPKDQASIGQSSNARRRPRTPVTESIRRMTRFGLWNKFKSNAYFIKTLKTGV